VIPILAPQKWWLTSRNFRSSSLRKLNNIIQLTRWGARRSSATWVTSRYPTLRCQSMTRMLYSRSSGSLTPTITHSLSSTNTRGAWRAYATCLASPSPSATPSTFLPTSKATARLTTQNSWSTSKTSSFCSSSTRNCRRYSTKKEWTWSSLRRPIEEGQPSTETKGGLVLLTVTGSGKFGQLMTDCVKVKTKRNSCASQVKKRQKTMENAEGSHLWLAALRKIKSKGI